MRFILCLAILATPSIVLGQDLDSEVLLRLLAEIDSLKTLERESDIPGGAAGAAGGAVGSVIAALAAWRVAQNMFPGLLHLGAKKDAEGKPVNGAGWKAGVDGRLKRIEHELEQRREDIVKLYEKDQAQGDRVARIEGRLEERR